MEQVGTTFEIHPSVVAWYLTKVVTQSLTKPNAYLLLACHELRQAGHILAWIPIPLQLIHCHVGQEPRQDVVDLN